MHPLFAFRPIAVAAICCASASACGGEAISASQATPPADDSGAPGADAAHPSSDAAIGTCSCPAGQVWRNHACLSTLDLGCGSACSSDSECGAGSSCEQCGASSSCDTRDCRPACAPTELHMGPIPPDSLRIVPTQGAAGASSEVTVHGFAWYIGALGYGLRMGDETIVQFGGGPDCAFAFTAPPRAPGRVPVRVSQYGQDDWVLAGFFTYKAGDDDGCIQPGFPCETTKDCCATVDAPVSCSGGRCRAN